jgi:hypothetical protein
VVLNLTPYEQDDEAEAAVQAMERNVNIAQHYGWHIEKPFAYSIDKKVIGIVDKSAKDALED